jgi:hypothetical protein
MNQPVIARLSQRRFFERREYSLFPDSLELTRKRLSSRLTITIPLTELPSYPDVIVESAPKRWLLFVLTAIATIALIIAAIVNPTREGIATAIAFTIAAAAAAIFARAGKREWLRFDCGTRSLLFLRDRPTRGEFAAFLEMIEEGRRRVLLTNRAASAVEVQIGVAAELERLFRLRERSALTQREYELLKEEIISSGEAHEPRPADDELAN